MATYRTLKPEEAPEKPKTVVLSHKAQLYLGYLGADLQHIVALRDAYLEARTAENINRITAFEMERLGVENALRLATRGKALKE